MGYVGFSPMGNTLVYFKQENKEPITKSFDVAKHLPKKFNSKHTIQFSLLNDERIILVYDMGEIDFEVIGLSDEEEKQWKLDAKLFKYSREGDLTKVKELINHGANPSHKKPNGVGPVEIARSFEQPVVVDYLLSIKDKVRKSNK